MRCFSHRDVDAVGMCKNCYRGLCTDCAVDVTNGLACRDRCEAQVIATNDVIERGKTGYQKASGAYARNAILYALMGGVMFLVGALTLPTGWVLVVLGIVMFIGAALTYGTSIKMRKVGP